MCKPVALFTRAWIEIRVAHIRYIPLCVALFTRAWIEIFLHLELTKGVPCRPLHEGVD